LILSHNFSIAMFRLSVPRTAKNDAINRPGSALIPHANGAQMAKAITPRTSPRKELEQGFPNSHALFPWLDDRPMLEALGKNTVPLSITHRNINVEQIEQRPKQPIRLILSILIRPT